MHLLNKLIFLFYLVSSFSSWASASPNFILILTDDHGWTSSSTLMDKHNPLSVSDYHETPHIDQLARSGMRFSQGYSTAALCTPTRRSILFGQTQLRQGPDEGFDQRYDPYSNGFLTIPLMLKDSDPQYRTAHFGKWHQKTGIYSPEDFGYDQSDGRTSNGDGSIFEHKEDKWKNVFITDDPKHSGTISQRGVSFIRRNAEAGNPFFLQLSYYATHVDIQATQEDYDHFKSKPRGRHHDHPGFAGMLHYFDRTLGWVLDQVEASGVEDNTYIILLADNGGAPNIPPQPSSVRLRMPDSLPRPSRNHPLRAGKWTVYEGGVRVPFIVKGPGIPAGSQSDVPVVAYDILPTLAELAGYPEPMPETVDGGSFANLLDDGKGRVERPVDAIFHHRAARSYLQSAIRHGDFKLVKYWEQNYFGGPRLELYDLSTDLGERIDLAKMKPEKARKLEAILMKYLKEIDAFSLNALPALR